MKLGSLFGYLGKRYNPKAWVAFVSGFRKESLIAEGLMLNYCLTTLCLTHLDLNDL